MPELQKGRTVVWWTIRRFLFAALQADRSRQVAGGGACDLGAADSRPPGWDRVTRFRFEDRRWRGI